MVLLHSVPSYVTTIVLVIPVCEFVVSYFQFLIHYPGTIIISVVGSFGTTVITNTCL